jgi:hypothetical protein
MQQLSTLTTEGGLAQRMIDQQHIAVLMTLPFKGRPGASGCEESL